MDEILEWLGNAFAVIIVVLSVMWFSLYYYGGVEMANNFLLNTVPGKAYLYIYSIFNFLTEFVTVTVLFGLALCVVLNILCRVFSGVLNSLLRYVSCFIIFPLFLSYHFFTHLIGYFNGLVLPGALFGFYFYLPTAGITMVIYGYALAYIYFEYIKEYQVNTKIVKDNIS